MPGNQSRCNLNDVLIRLLQHRAVLWVKSPDQPGSESEPERDTLKLASAAIPHYLAPAYGKSGHHRFRLRRLDGGVVHRARQPRAARPHRQTARRPPHHHQHRRKFPRLPRRRGRLRIDGADAEAGRTLRRPRQLWPGRAGGFFETALRAHRGRRKSGDRDRHHRHRRQPQTSGRARRGFARNQGGDLLRHLRRRAAGFPQPAARRGRRRRFRVRRSAVSDAVRVGHLPRAPARRVARVQNHGRTARWPMPKSSPSGIPSSPRCSM